MMTNQQKENQKRQLLENLKALERLPCSVLDELDGDELFSMIDITTWWKRNAEHVFMTRGMQRDLFEFQLQPGQEYVFTLSMKSEQQKRHGVFFGLIRKGPQRLYAVKTDSGESLLIDRIDVVQIEHP